MEFYQRTSTTNDKQVLYESQLRKKMKENTNVQLNVCYCGHNDIDDNPSSFVTLSDSPKRMIDWASFESPTIPDDFIPFYGRVFSWSNPLFSLKLLSDSPNMLLTWLH